jgi:hypothetical protein
MDGPQSLPADQDCIIQVGTPEPALEEPALSQGVPVAGPDTAEAAEAAETVTLGVGEAYDKFAAAIDGASIGCRLMDLLPALDASMLTIMRNGFRALARYDVRVSTQCFVEAFDTLSEVHPHAQELAKEMPMPPFARHDALTLARYITESNIIATPEKVTQFLLHAQRRLGYRDVRVEDLMRDVLEHLLKYEEETRKTATAAKDGTLATIQTRAWNFALAIIRETNAPWAHEAMLDMKERQFAALVGQERSEEAIKKALAEAQIARPEVPRPTYPPRVRQRTVEDVLNEMNEAWEAADGLQGEQRDEALLAALAAVIEEYAAASRQMLDHIRAAQADAAAGKDVSQRLIFIDDLPPSTEGRMQPVDRFVATFYDVLFDSEKLTEHERESRRRLASLIPTEVVSAYLKIVLEGKRQLLPRPVPRLLFDLYPNVKAEASFGMLIYEGAKAVHETQEAIRDNLETPDDANAAYIMALSDAVINEHIATSASLGYLPAIKRLSLLYYAKAADAADVRDKEVLRVKAMDVICDGYFAVRSASERSALFNHVMDMAFVRDIWQRNGISTLEPHEHVFATKADGWIPMLEALSDVDDDDEARGRKPKKKLPKAQRKALAAARRQKKQTGKAKATAGKKKKKSRQ